MAICNSTSVSKAAKSLISAGQKIVLRVFVSSGLLCNFDYMIVGFGRSTVLDNEAFARFTVFWQREL